MAVSHQSPKQRINSAKLGKCSRTCKGTGKAARKKCLRDCMKGVYQWTKPAKKRAAAKRKRRRRAA